MYKRVFAYFVILALTTGLFACDDESVIDAYIVPEQTEYTIGAEGGSISIKFDANILDHAYTEGGWLRVNNISASTKSSLPSHIHNVTIEVDANTGSEVRTGLVKGVCFAKVSAVKIIQKGK
ncbi:hypothetical protein M2137_000759 [Parabacteroides sp. PFB2-10]|uniref:BACON domain-containing protein n=1 Tax=Parabacteroides sp. PFB2-10 TaxID=1742405 RepID=UPI00247481CE|nr:BACON domain-containing protein [Parabacteroides sp. PFB2-10]MDH6311996.1 hypothetical protein [Parabacteroides sp. PFB2-10]MDL2245284.1 BACON domain-containing protein [Parabacteroides sp. OttesenSCG-928-J18]